VALNLVWTRSQAIDLAERAGAEFEIDEDEIRLKVAGIEAILRDTVDVSVAHEIFVGRVWKFELPGSLLVLDVGSNIGLASLSFLSTHDAEVWAFDLVPSTARLARANLDLNPQLAARAKVFEYGLSDSDREFDLSVDPDHRVDNSIFTEKRGSGSVIEKVAVRDAGGVLREALDQLNGRKLVMKLDAEGAEYEILERLSNLGLLGKIDLLLLEWHVRPDRDPEEIRKLLRGAGYFWTEHESESFPVGFLSAYRPAPAAAQTTKR